LELSYVHEPDVRRALRAMQQQMTETLARQQTEIDAILEVLLEKHLTSLGEFKRKLVMLQQDAARSQRIHGAIASAGAPAPPTGHPPR
jgi:Arc/MetJ-type ribon-helix-helix transcriptional regulator